VVRSRSFTVDAADPGVRPAGIARIRRDLKRHDQHHPYVLECRVVDARS